MAAHKKPKATDVEETEQVEAENPHKVKHLTGEERIDALCSFLQGHGIHVPEEIAAKE